MNENVDPVSKTISAASARIATPDKPKITDLEKIKDLWRENGLRLSFPDLEKLIRMKSLTQKRAATELGCSELSIRRLLDDLRLTRSEKGRIIVDEKFVEEYQRRHEPSPQQRSEEDFKFKIQSASTFISPRVPRIPAFQSADPVEQNPFAANDPRHEVWKRATLTAEAELYRLNAQFLQGGSTDLVHFDGRAIAMAAAKFDIWARRAIQVVWDDQGLRNYDDWLSSYANAWLKAFEPRLQNHLPAFAIEMHRTLLSRVEHWRSEARRYRAEQLASDHLNSGEVATVQNSKSQRSEGVTNLKRSRVRGPDVRKHKERADFEDALITDLASIREHSQDSTGTDLKKLRQMLPKSSLWEILNPSEQERLISEEFKPKAYARRLAARKFGVNEETIKKSRQHAKH